MEVTSAELKDGMLHVHVVRIIPEDKKPKVIDIK
jgi:HSP20 family molecular chaperone IbpA